MKTNWKKFTSLVCALVMLTCTLAACATPTENPSAGTDATEPPAAANTETPTTGDDVTQPESDPYATAGSVSIAYPEAEIAEIQPVLEAFRTQYPNIEVVEVPFAGSTGGAFNEFLTQQAAANDMPDLMWLDWNDFAPQVASGYVMPLNELMENDPEAAYVPSGMTDPYTYGGKLYALPCQMNAMGITMNLDMLEELNIEKPSYDWTFAEFETILKKAITADTCAAATLEDLDQVYSAQTEGYFYPAYDYVNQKFSFTVRIPACIRHARCGARQ